jgi:hypothetical protein
MRQAFLGTPRICCSYLASDAFNPESFKVETADVGKNAVEDTHGRQFEGALHLPSGPGVGSDVVSSSFSANRFDD